MIPHPLCTGYSIILTPVASKDLSKLDKADVTAIIAKIHELASGSCNLDIKKLKMPQSLYRLRVGHYRVVYQIFQKTITVYIIAIGHRKDIYKRIS